jgi:hypothetical protein
VAFEWSNFLIVNRNPINHHYILTNYNIKMSKVTTILDIISARAVHPHLIVTSNFHPVFNRFLIPAFLKGHCDIDLNIVAKTSDSIK